MHTHALRAKNLSSRMFFFAGALAGAAMLAACASGPGGREGLPTSITLALAPSQVAVGETVTATATPDAPLSDRVTIDWVTTGSSLKTEKDATVAHLKFAKPGTYRVTAKLMIDSTEVSRTTADVPVSPK